jgi:hypothetical protein
MRTGDVPIALPIPDPSALALRRVNRRAMCAIRRREVTSRSFLI